MLQMIKEAYQRRARNRKRAALSAELESIYTARRHFSAREKQIFKAVRQLDLEEVHYDVKSRKSRAW